MTTRKNKEVIGYWGNLGSYSGDQSVKNSDTTIRALALPITLCLGFVPEPPRVGPGNPIVGVKKAGTGAFA